MRVNLSVAIVAMTENRTTVQADGTIIQERDFDWNSREKGFALGAFFYGYICTQFIGGFVASKFGGSLVSQTKTIHQHYGLIKSITITSKSSLSLVITLNLLINVFRFLAWEFLPLR